jgi:hypothetical protein
VGDGEATLAFAITPSTTTLPQVAVTVDGAPAPCRWLAAGTRLHLEHPAIGPGSALAVRQEWVGATLRLAVLVLPG